MLLKLGRENASPELLQAMLSPMLEFPVLHAPTAEAGLDAICSGLGGHHMTDEHFRLIARHKLLALNKFDRVDVLTIQLRDARIRALLDFVNSREDASAARDWMHQVLCDPGLPPSDTARTATYMALMKTVPAPDATPRQALAAALLPK